MTSEAEETIVRAYLAAMEQRDLPAAQALLADGFTMTFPGNVRMTSLSDLVAWSKPRYRFVKKTYDRFDTMPGLCYCFGMLHGEWLDGTAFSGIRFIDRFEVAEGRITRQDVWNDMAEMRP
jgi:hypothetical protein